MTRALLQQALDALLYAEEKVYSQGEDCITHAIAGLRQALAQPELPAFNDPQVQIAYEILGDSETCPPEGEHWEGFAARRIIDALRLAIWQQTPAEIFAIVTDRIGDEGLSIAVHDGVNYAFSDGDCFDRDGDTLDGYTAEFLTHYQFEQRLNALSRAAQPEPEPLTQVAIVGRSLMRVDVGWLVEVPHNTKLYAYGIKA